MVCIYGGGVQIRLLCVHYMYIYIYTEVGHEFRDQEFGFRFVKFSSASDMAWGFERLSFLVGSCTRVWA